MKNPLEFAREILTEKEQHPILPCDSFVKFLIQRYLSTASMTHCNLINSTLNMKLKGWDDDQEIYNFLKCLIPKVKSAYMPYIWQKKEYKDPPFDIGLVAENLEISKRELEDLIDIFPDLVDNYTETSEKILQEQK
jgi:hypothetical protein